MADFGNMNAAQLSAVTHTEGPLLVLAGPGSGKTLTVSGRIRYLIEERGVPPEQILAITFTREAAVSLQRRFQELSSAALPVRFGTFHSVFFQILQQSNLLRSTHLLTNSKKKELMISVLRKYCSGSGCEQSTDSLGEDALLILSALSYYKNTLREEEAAMRLPIEWRCRFRQIMGDYQKAVQACGMLDFDDMLCLCRRLLTEDAGVCRRWQERFRHILIDEFQDINPVQYEVVKLLAGTHACIFAVGDDDQAIYGFRGSEPACLKRFEEEYGAGRILLDVNYRSHPQIVRASLAVIGENRDRFRKQLRACRSEEGLSGDGFSGDGQDRVRLLSFPDQEAQYTFLTERLKRFRSENADRPKEECAVLFRTNARMQGLAVRLRAAGIPFVMSERAQSIYDHFIVRDVMAYLKLAAGQWEREALLRAVNRPSRSVSREAAGSGGCSIRQLRSYYERCDMPPGERNNVLTALDRFERQLKTISGLSPSLAVAYVQKAVGYEGYLRQLAGKEEERWREWREMLEWLKADAGGYSCMKEWQAAQEAYTADAGRRGDRRSSGGRPERGGPVIRLMTVHGAKGLEFDTVIIPDCNENVFPHGRLRETAEVEEERRIFYVAMTRAKENLELLCLTGTKERPRLPSRFLDPLLDHSSISSSNSQLSRYSSKASETLSYSSSSSM